jgi:tRNA(fMet)-specific endonuclease VapC
MESTVLGLVLDSSSVIAAEILSLIPFHPVSSRTGWLVGQIDGQEAAKGNMLPFNDLMIAAAAIEQGYAVLTGNVRHFEKIPGLVVIPQQK